MSGSDERLRTVGPGGPYPPMAGCASAYSREIVARPPGPGTSLNRVVGPGRDLALIRASFDQVTQIAHSHGATVNDVLLAVTGGGVRGLLGNRGNPSRVSPCRSTCPSRCARPNGVIRHGETWSR